MGRRKSEKEARAIEAENHKLRALLGDAYTYKVRPIGISEAFQAARIAAIYPPLEAERRELLLREAICRIAERSRDRPLQLEQVEDIEQIAVRALNVR